MAKKCGENDVQPEKLEVICYGSLSRYVDPKIRPVHSRHHLAALALAWIDIFLFLATLYLKVANSSKTTWWIAYVEASQDAASCKGRSWTRSGDVAWCSWVANEDTLKSLSTKIYWDLHGFTIQLTSWPCEENSLGAWVRRFCPGIPPGGNVLPADLAAGPHKTLGKAQFSDVIAGDPVSGLSFYDKKP